MIRGPKLKLDDEGNLGRPVRLEGAAARRFHVESILNRPYTEKLAIAAQTQEHAEIMRLMREALAFHQRAKVPILVRPVIPAAARAAAAAAAPRRIPRLSRFGAGVRLATRVGWVVTVAYEVFNILDRILTSPAGPPRRPPAPPRVAEAFADDAANLGRFLNEAGGRQMIRQIANVSTIPPPSPSIRFDYVSFAKQLRARATILDETFAALLRAQTSLVINRCIELTPPFSGARQSRMQKMDKGTYTGTARKRGQDRVALDIRKVFCPVNELWKFKRIEEFNRAVAKQDEEAIRTILGPKFHFAKIGPEPDPAMHQQARDRQGRVRRSRPPQQLVLKSQSVGRYIREKQKRVGIAKSGWRASVNLFGLPEGRKLPAWISRHNGEGSARDDTVGRTGKAMRTFFSNEVKFVQAKGKELRIIELAQSGQAKAMRSNIRRIFNDLGKKTPA